MTFKFPNNIPAIDDRLNELTDFAECLCLLKGQISQTEISSILGRGDDNFNDEGCDDDDDMRNERLDEVMNEIDWRSRACSGGYPFLLDDTGSSIVYDTEPHPRSSIYLYLLLCTRLNMKKDRCHDGIDGALVLESLSAHVLKNYLGTKRAKSLVFGTSEQGGFCNKINKLGLALGEGNAYKSRVAEENAKDGKLDVVGWIPFTDELQGKLIIFAQCKTGTNWKDDIAQLQPSNFISKWFSDQFTVDPMRAFLISEAPNRASWYNHCKDAGLLFDRCRIVDFCDDIPPDLLDTIQRWTQSACDHIKTVTGW